MSEQRERYWRGVLQRWAVSGTTVVAFCEREGVSTASFYTWRKRLAGQDAATGERATGVEDEVEHSGPVFVPVRLSGRPEGDVAESVRDDALPAQKAAVEVVLPEGIVVRVADGAARGTIGDVLAALGVKP